MLKAEEVPIDSTNIQMNNNGDNTGATNFDVNFNNTAPVAEVGDSFQPHISMKGPKGGLSIQKGPTDR